MKRYPPEFQEYAEFFFGKISHISQDEFESALEQSIRMCVDVCGQALVIFNPDKTARKSNTWVYQIALEKNLLPQQTNAVTAEEYDLQKGGISLGKLLRSEDAPQQVMLLDDACYSGAQITHIIKNMAFGYEKLTGQTLHLVIPFVTSRAKQSIRDAAEEVGIKVKFYDIQTPKTKTIREIMDDLLQEDPAKHKRILEILKKIYETDLEYQMGKTLFYFDHKKPDRVSILTGYQEHDRGATLAESMFADEVMRSHSILDGPFIDSFGRLAGFHSIIPPLQSPYGGLTSYRAFVERHIKGSEWESRLH